MSGIDSITREFKVNLYKKILKFNDKKVFEKIFNVIKKNNEIHTVNTNGIFFDLNKISVKSFKELSEIIMLESLNEDNQELTYNNYSESDIDKKINVISNDKKLNNKEIHFLKKLNN